MDAGDILKTAWPLGHSLLNSFFFLPSVVRLGSLESEGNDAHCHSQIHGTKPRKPGWEPKQKQPGAGRRRIYSSFYKLLSAPLEGSQPTSSPKGRGKWLLMV